MLALFVFYVFLIFTVFVSPIKNFSTLFPAFLLHLFTAVRIYNLVVLALPVFSLMGATVYWPKRLFSNLLKQLIVLCVSQYPGEKQGNDKPQSQPITRCSLFLQNIAFKNRVCWSAVHSNHPTNIIIPGIGKFRYWWYLIWAPWNSVWKVVTWLYKTTNFTFSFSLCT